MVNLCCTRPFEFFKVDFVTDFNTVASVKVGYFEDVIDGDGVVTGQGIEGMKWDFKLEATGE